MVVTTAGTEEIAELTMLATEAGGGIVALEAPHTSDPAFDPTMVLFKTIVQGGVGSMADRPTQHGADRPGIGAMAIGGYPVGATKAHGRFGRSEERLGRLHVDTGVMLVLPHFPCCSSSRCVKDPRSEQLESCAAVHRPLQHLDAADLAFDGTGGPGQYERCIDGVEVAAQAGREPGE